MVYTVDHHINGKKINTIHNPQPIFNPAYGETIGEVSMADESICQQAISSALHAWETWKHSPAVKRARILFRFRDLLEQNQQELAQLVTQEHGKTIEDAKGSLARAIEVVEFHCGILTQLQGSFSADVASGIDCYTIRQPLGVCAGISPFNFPLMVPVWMMIPAIASGNTFILKPSEQDPSAPVRLIELLEEAGLPAGVVNCVQGNKQTVDFLLQHPDIAAFTAVASTPVAESIYKTAITNGKRAHTFGGAKNHGVVMPDADLEQAAKAIVGAAYGSAGERCMAISVVVVVGDDTANQLLQHLVPLVQAIRVDCGDAANVDMGPLISRAHHQRVLNAIDQGIAEGAKIVVDGRNFAHPKHSKGFFMGPVLFDAVDESMSIYQNEIFGPVLVIMRVQQFEQALDLVNRHQYGNGTAIFTRNGYFAREYCHRVQVGMVGVNIPIPVPIASHPFGGWKHSSFGDRNMHGMESIQFYTRLKTITSKWPSTKMLDNGFNMPIHE